MTTAPARQKDYRDFLKQELAKEGLPAKVVAERIGVSAAFLSQLMNRKRGLSEDRAATIAARLGWDEWRARYFTVLVRYGNARSSALKASLRQELLTLERPRDEDLIKGEIFSAISQWYHGAILELSDITDFQPGPEWIADRLGITAAEASAAVERLLRLGFLQWEGGTLKKKAVNLSYSYDTSEALRQYIGQILNLAQRAVDDVGRKDPIVRNTIFALAEDEIPMVKNRIEHFFRDLKNRPRKSSTSKVFNISMQFFRLDKSSS